MATNIPQDDFQKTALRLPKELHSRLHEAAAKGGRSYNAEIVSRLETSFQLPKVSEIQFLLAKFTFDLAEARSERSSMNLHVMSLAMALRMAASALKHEQIRESAMPDVDEWLESAADAIKEGYGRSGNEDQLITDLKKATDHLMSLFSALPPLQNGT